MFQVTQLDLPQGEIIELSEREGMPRVWLMFLSLGTGLIYATPSTDSSMRSDITLSLNPSLGHGIRRPRITVLLRSHAYRGRSQCLVFA